MAYKVIDVADFEWFVDKTYPVPQQYGPLRQYEKPMRCMGGTKKYRCGSETYFKVRGMPKCTIHALRELNEIICELTGEGPDNGDSNEE